MSLFTCNSSCVGDPSSGQCLTWSPANHLAYTVPSTIYLFSAVSTHDVSASGSFVRQLAQLKTDVLPKTSQSSGSKNSKPVSSEPTFIYSCWSPLLFSRSNGSLLLTISSAGDSIIWDIDLKCRESASIFTPKVNLKDSLLESFEDGIENNVPKCAEFSDSVCGSNGKYYTILASGLSSNNLALWLFKQNELSVDVYESQISLSSVCSLLSIYNLTKFVPSLDNQCSVVNLSFSPWIPSIPGSINSQILVALGMSNGLVIVLEMSFVLDTDGNLIIHTIELVNTYHTIGEYPVTYMTWYREASANNLINAENKEYNNLKEDDQLFTVYSLSTSKGLDIFVNYLSIHSKLEQATNYVCNTYSKIFSTSSHLDDVTVVMDIEFINLTELRAVTLNGVAYNLTVDSKLIDEITNPSYELKEILAMSTKISKSETKVDADLKYIQNYTTLGKPANKDRNQITDYDEQTKSEVESMVNEENVENNNVEPVSYETFLFGFKSNQGGMVAFVLSTTPSAPIVISIPSCITCDIIVQPLNLNIDANAIDVTNRLISYIDKFSHVKPYTSLRPCILHQQLQYLIVTEKAFYDDTQLENLTTIFINLRKAIYKDIIFRTLDKNPSGSKLDTVTSYVKTLESSKSLLISQLIVSLISSIISESFSDDTQLILSLILHDTVHHINLMKTIYLITTIAEDNVLQDKLYSALLLANIKYLIKYFDKDFFEPLKSNNKLYFAFRDKMIKSDMDYALITLKKSEKVITRKIFNTVKNGASTSRISSVWSSSVKIKISENLEPFEKCPICTADIPFQSPFIGVCKNEHMFERCPISLIILDDSKKCDCCDRSTLNIIDVLQNYLDSSEDVEETFGLFTKSLPLNILEKIKYCIWCAAPLY